MKPEYSPVKEEYNPYAVTSVELSPTGHYYVPDLDLDAKLSSLHVGSTQPIPAWELSTSPGAMHAIQVCLCSAVSCLNVSSMQLTSA